MQKLHFDLEDREGVNIDAIIAFHTRFVSDLYRKPVWANEEKGIAKTETNIDRVSVYVPHNDDFMRVSFSARSIKALADKLREIEATEGEEPYED